MFDPVIFDRALIGFSLAVHIILAVMGIAIPVIVSAAEFIGIRTGNQIYETIAKRISVALVIFFAVGTASGMLVAVELFALWPSFMVLVGQVALLTVLIEVGFFFLEAVFLAIYIYGWDSFKNRYAHWAMSIPVIIGAGGSAMMITMLNAFMNTPVGFNIQNYLATGTLSGINPLAVFNGPSTWVEVSHVLSTSYFTGAMIVAAYLAYRMLRAKRDSKVYEYHAKALRIALAISAIAIIFTIYTGINSITAMYAQQPEKYAAMEADLIPQSHAPEYIGGLYINGTLQYYIPIPDMQSVLATGSPNGTVPGLSSYPQSTWPPLIIHPLFDLMVILGFALGGFFALVAILYLLRRTPLKVRPILWLTLVAGSLSVLLLEAGWIVDELGRQPWIIYGVMTVNQAANYSQSVVPITIVLMAVYIIVVPFTLYVLKKVFDGRPLEKELR
ncbi:MAG: cytochrome ubiquinol oxidase subunit I [Candidatus Micrarchaeota archaeon]|nr:cytochrome ubiquinol oxidase subunit I [Candidatus Micrarchaeota archaeon]